MGFFEIQKHLRLEDYEINRGVSVTLFFMPDFSYVFNSNYFAGNWRSGEECSYLYSKDFEHLLTNIQVINHKDIAWVGKHHYPNYAGRKCNCCGGVRYLNADISYPGVVIKDGPNPYGNPYLLIDGRHRLTKKLFLGIDQSEHYVLYWDEVREYLKWKEKN